MFSAASRSHHVLEYRLRHRHPKFGHGGLGVNPLSNFGRHRGGVAVEPVPQYREQLFALRECPYQAPIYRPLDELADDTIVLRGGGAGGEKQEACLRRKDRHLRPGR